MLSSRPSYGPIWAMMVLPSSTCTPQSPPPQAGPPVARKGRPGAMTVSYRCTSPHRNTTVPFNTRLAATATSAPSPEGTNRIAASSLAQL